MDYDSAARTLSRYTQSIRELRLAVAVSGLTVEEAWTKVDEAENPDADPDRALPVLKASDDMQAALEQANAVLRDLARDLGVLAPHRTLAVPHGNSRIVGRALELTRAAGRMERLASMDDPDTGNTFVSEALPVGPVLPLELLDEAVRNAAAAHWAGGKYRNAVADAAAAVNALTQSRMGRTDESDRELMTDAFSENPPLPGRPRLRCPGDPASESVRSLKEGAKLIAMGIYSTSRNPAAHGIGDWNPVTAFESLAALSMLARWVRHWDIEQAAGGAGAHVSTTAQF